MNDIRLDPEAVRGFGDDVWTELENTIRPWIAEIVAGLDTHGRKAPNDFGARHVAYAAPKLDAVHGSEAADLKRWLSDLKTGLEALSLGSAVMAEQLASTDIDSALWLHKKGNLDDIRGMVA